MADGSPPIYRLTMLETMGGEVPMYLEDGVLILNNGRLDLNLKAADLAIADMTMSQPGIMVGFQEFRERNLRAPTIIVRGVQRLNQFTNTRVGYSVWQSKISEVRVGGSTPFLGVTLLPIQDHGSVVHQHTRPIAVSKESAARVSLEVVGRPKMEKRSGNAALRGFFAALSPVESNLLALLIERTPPGKTLDDLRTELANEISVPVDDISPDVVLQAMKRVVDTSKFFPSFENQITMHPGERAGVQERFFFWRPRKTMSSSVKQ